MVTNVFDQDGNSFHNQTFFLHSSQSDEDCDIFDPVSGGWSLVKCDSQRGAVCQFKKGNENMSNISTFILDVT